MVFDRSRRDPEPGGSAGTIRPVAAGARGPAEALRGLPELARRLEDLNCVILQRAVEKNTVAVFTVRGGRIDESRMLRFAEFASQPRSVEQILRQWLEPDEAQNLSAAKLTHAQQSFREWEDHLTLLARWFYGKPRVGEIFFREGTVRSSAGATQELFSIPTPSGGARRNSEWPYRRILRACSRLLAPPDETGKNTTAAPEL